jgi:predicted DNA binding CopG/RHH family protein
MSEFDWSDEKNATLERTRSVCFEDVVVCIQNGDVLDVIRHPNRGRYPGQNIIVLNVGGYVWLIPYVKQKGGAVPQDDHPKSQSNAGVSEMKKDTMQFDEEELQILQDFERGEFQSIRNFRAEKRELEEAAGNTLQKDKRINIRISSRDLERIQMRAAREGVPYQTYISSSLHKLVSGRLKEMV